jgi:hypothetical protein
VTAFPKEMISVSIVERATVWTDSTEVSSVVKEEKNSMSLVRGISILVSEVSEVEGSDSAAHGEEVEEVELLRLEQEEEERMEQVSASSERVGTERRLEHRM